MSALNFLVNCGFARVAICHCSEIGKGKRTCDLNVEERDRISETYIQTNGFICGYNTLSGQFRETRFHRNCKKMINQWSNKGRKWEVHGHFLTGKVASTSTSNKTPMLDENCTGCALTYQHFTGWY